MMIDQVKCWLCNKYKPTHNKLNFFPTKNNQLKIRFLYNWDSSGIEAAFKRIVSQKISRLYALQT
jgi:hypothetical protein